MTYKTNVIVKHGRMCDFGRAEHTRDISIQPTPSSKRCDEIPKFRSRAGKRKFQSVTHLRLRFWQVLLAHSVCCSKLKTLRFPNAYRNTQTYKYVRTHPCLRSGASTRAGMFVCLGLCDVFVRLAQHCAVPQTTDGAQHAQVYKRVNSHSRRTHTCAKHNQFQL